MVASNNVIFKNIKYITVFISSVKSKLSTSDLLQPTPCSLHTRYYTESHVFGKKKLWNTDFECRIGSYSELRTLVCCEWFTERKYGRISTILLRPV